MVAQLPVVGVARCVVRGLSASQPIINVFHVANGAAPYTAYTQASINQLATSMASLWVGNLQPLTNSGYTGVGVTCTDLSSDLGVVGEALTGGTGSGVGANTPNSSCVCITWRISRHYRGGHPRSYIGPLAGTNITTPTTLLGTFITTANNAASAFRGAVNALVLSGTTQSLVCVHRVKTQGSPPAATLLNPPVVDPIVGNTVDSRVDSQRRRLGRDR